MFELLETLPPDPILGLMDAFRADPDPHKIDLGVGVYRDEHGDTPILACVREAQRHRIDTERTKSYIGPPGTPDFNQAMRQLIFGRDHALISERRIASVQTPGGCGALRVAAELVMRARKDMTLWVSEPTWANHIPLLGSAGLTIRPYAYYNAATHGLDAGAMMDALSSVAAGDIVLLHGCCHNPSGVDLKPEHWQAVADLANARGFTPFVDLAYQGLGDGLDQDAYGVRLLGGACKELLVASSCSKNFGLYRERVGVLQIAAQNADQAVAIQSQLEAIARGIYSMPPAHGAAIVETILNDEALHASWVEELTEMRERINHLRDILAVKLGEHTGQDFEFIRDQRGMFSFLGISPAQIARLRNEFSIYLVDSSRVNVAGINNTNLDYFTRALATVLAG